MLIDCIGCLHGCYPNLEGGDLLIITGDLTTNDSVPAWNNFFTWAEKQEYKKIIYIAGNHDNAAINFCTSQEAREMDLFEVSEKLEYLCDNGIEFEGLKIWGSPWTAQFRGINPKCCAFTVRHFDHTDELLAEYWKKIPDDTDILITHGPPFGIFDLIKDRSCNCGYDCSFPVGSKSLKEHSMARIKPRLHIFSHIHEHGGKVLDTTITKFINCSIMNEEYEPLNKPIRIILTT